MRNCENCPASWEDRGYEGEVYDCGCFARENGEMVDGCRIPLFYTKLTAYIARRAEKRWSLG